ncbi:RNA polymerase sigma factor SigZ [Sinanaerobacter chloroacetimidivorans]|jgi:RNA polymerase sigma-70 factor (ECF subfamily)|uniref:RNA polymerase sigma factor SigZ n=1 Tax=Sinanaerobacter chloroacetimidivorans TaxID=2818044 RepID=A0A8J7W3L5_9FIRM|nr:RNA polymerase sigma factor SigZ [Sinanaerobacter chloroacetimidivorans]MBR0598753.1 RNA polymerase sigma factor SigZ [Sinanaerobacter chloroacetimidivorans]
MINLECIFEEVGIPLKVFIRRRVNNDQDTEDILQNVFLKIHQNIHTIKDYNKIHPWIYQITRNAVIDFYRTQKGEIITDDFIREMNRDTFEGGNVNEEIGQCLKLIICHLPEKYKEALLLTEFQNLTQKELAEHLGLTLSGAKSRVQRARAKLKELLLCCCRVEFDHYGNVIDYERRCGNCKFC